MPFTSLSPFPLFRSLKNKKLAEDIVQYYDNAINNAFGDKVICSQ
jgi:hypothetical protein